MGPTHYIDEEVDANNDKEKPNHEAEGARLGNLLLSIQVESEQLRLQREKEVDNMINEFLGYD